jgi:CelD/BcsL family acetyltransferase involved in cellulose biosynthesis
VRLARSHASFDAERGAQPAGDVTVVDFASFTAATWNGVPMHRRTPMQQHIWARAAAETLSPHAPVLVVTVGPPQRPIALAPLMRSPSGPARLRLLGAEELGESVEVVYQDERALEALARGLSRIGLALGFGHYLADTLLTAALRRAYRGRGLVVSKRLAMRGSPYITLDASWIEPEQHFSARRRSDFRRMQRNAEKLGAVSTQIIEPSPDALGPLLDEAIDIEAKGWKERAGTAMSVDRRLERFYRRYAQLACEAGILRLCFLRIAGKAVAMQLAVETEGRFWLFKIGYDEAYARCSPGNLLMRETISYAARRELKSYEFLGKEAPWTALWTQAAHSITALRTYPANVAGLTALVVDCGHRAKQLFEQFAARRSDRESIVKPRLSDA